MLLLFAVLKRCNWKRWMWFYSLCQSVGFKVRLGTLHERKMNKDRTLLLQILWMMSLFLYFFTKWFRFEVSVKFNLFNVWTFPRITTATGFPRIHSLEHSRKSKFAKFFWGPLLHAKATFKSSSVLFFGCCFYARSDSACVFYILTCWFGSGCCSGLHAFSCWHANVFCR